MYVKWSEFGRDVTKRKVGKITYLNPINATLRMQQTAALAHATLPTLIASSVG